MLLPANLLANIEETKPNTMIVSQTHNRLGDRSFAFWILLKQEIIRWQWHQLDHMQIICTSLQTDNHASTPSLNFLWAGCSSWRPINSINAHAIPK